MRDVKFKRDTSKKSEILFHKVANLYKRFIYWWGGGGGEGEFVLLTIQTSIKF